ncbi:hypothetical protein AO715_06565 [Xanthomonas sp. Mitacek01]|nr:hypothetical protein AO715_06565 [Xanthomonas sp. Mitacek01]
MDREQMDEFVANAALLAAHLTRQCEQAADDQRDAAGALQTAAAHVTEHIAAGRDALLQATTLAVRDALTGEFDATTARAEVVAGRLEHLLARLDHAQTGLGAHARLLGGGALLALALSAVAIVGATGYLARLNLERAEMAGVRAEVLEALQQVAITACDGRPCIKLEDGLTRWTGNEDYVLVDTRRGQP